MSARIKLKKANNIPILTIAGELEPPDINHISKKLESLIKSKYQTVAVDLSETTYIDSHGLGMFVFIWKSMEKNDQQLVFLKPHPFIRTMFEGTNLNQILRVVDSLEDV